MKITIDTDKLKSAIQETLDGVDGRCIEAECRIGRSGRKEISIVVTYIEEDDVADEDLETLNEDDPIEPDLHCIKLGDQK